MKTSLIIRGDKMKCYIYFIINQLTNERYVGQTTNFSRRKNEHFEKLKENRHPNPKLQNVYNKYGKENFLIEKITFENLSKEELNEQEIYYIDYYNSYEKGYNLTRGGTGGDTKSKLNFDQFCFAYFGNTNYQGMTNRTGRYLGVDSACIAAIAKKKSYDYFREKAELLEDAEKQRYLKDFEEKLDLKNNPPWIKKKTLDDETTFRIMCVVSTYGRGIESAILKNFDLSKGFVFHLMTGNGRMEIKEKYKNTPKEKRIEIGREYFHLWQLQSYSNNKIKEEYKDLFVHYGIADLKAL